MWFFGDYGSKQQYLALKCTLWAYRQRPIDDELKTPGFDFAEGWLFDNNVRLVYIHAGMNTLPPAPVHKQSNGKYKGGKCKKGDKKCLAKYAQPAAPPQSPPPPAHGLTGDFMAAHGLTHTGDMDVVVRPHLTLALTHTCTRTLASALWRMARAWVPALRSDVQVTCKSRIYHQCLAYVWTQLGGEESQFAAGCPKR